jgi:hypothetical protein
MRLWLAWAVIIGDVAAIIWLVSGPHPSAHYPGGYDLFAAVCIVILGALTMVMALIWAASDGRKPNKRQAIAQETTTESQG